MAEVTGDVPKCRISEAEATFLRIPLRQTYQGSSLALDALESILVEVRAGERSAVAETCPFREYAGVSASAVWEEVRRMLPMLLGATPAEGLEELERWCRGRGGFTMAAMSGALEKLQDAEILGPRAGGTVPLVGTVLATEEGDLERELRGLRDRGYREFKVKVGYGADGGRSKLATLQRCLSDGEMLRVDANGVFDVRQAAELCSVMNPEHVRYFEQPLAVGDWVGLKQLAVLSAVPVMLDESIHDARDIEAASVATNVKYVKLKLMKSGTASGLIASAEHAASLGLTVILGNGVASDVGCADEAALHLKLGLLLPGEMNGFLKTRVPVVANPLTVVNGEMVLPASYRPEIMRRQLESYTCAKYRASS